MSTSKPKEKPAHILRLTLLTAYFIACLPLILLFMEGGVTSIEDATGLLCIAFAGLLVWFAAKPIARLIFRYFNAIRSFFYR